MLFSVLSFLTGIVVVQQFSVLPGEYWVIGLVIGCIALAWHRCWRFMFFVLGLLWAVVFANVRLAEKLPDTLQGQKIPIEGRIIGLPKYDDRKVRFDFAVTKPAQNFPNKIKLSWYFPNQIIKTGQDWKFTVKLKRPHGLMNPGGFDYERWLFMNNIGATGYIRSNPKPVLVTTKATWQSFDGLRQSIAENLDALIGKTKNIGIIKALTIGERQDISDKQWQVFRQTGTVHLLAISGLHIGLVSGITFFLVLKLGNRLGLISAQLVAAVAVVVVAFIYSALAGFSVPTQRALVMLIVAMTAICWQRNVTPLGTMAVSLLAVLLFDPLSVLSTGFWLSFLAVVLIIYSLSSRLKKNGYWYSAIKIHIVTAIGMAPLLLYYFQQVSIIAPLANLLTVPIISLIVVPLCLLAVVLMFVSLPLANHLLQFIDSIIQLLWTVLDKLASMPYATMTLPVLPVYAIVLPMLGVLLLLSPKGVPARWLALVLMLPLSFSSDDKLKPGQMTMTLLDVGQGLSVIVETRDHVLIYDTGAKYSAHYDMGNAVVVPYLKSKGINKADILLVSHGDNDHIGGAESIYKQIQVVKTLTSVPYQLPGRSARQCLAWQSWVWDEVFFNIISPPQGSIGKDNNNSCVLKISSKQGDFLLTGDIERQAEQALVKRFSDQLASDVLIAPHHGSKTSSTPAFLKQVKPAIVLISAGYRNRFYFPHQQVLDRYKQIKSTVFNTADQGALVVSRKNDGWNVIAIRYLEGKYWNK